MSIQTVKGIPLVPKLTTKHYPITLPPELHTRIRAEIKGDGGWQTLMRVLQEHTDAETPTAEIPEQLMHRLIPYAVKFGSGGYQSLIRWVLCLILEQHEGVILGQPKSLKEQVQ